MCTQLYCFCYGLWSTASARAAAAAAAAVEWPLQSQHELAYGYEGAIDLWKRQAVPAQVEAPAASAAPP